MTIKPAKQQTRQEAALHPALQEDTADTHYLGQFIPLHYHHNMLKDDNRMSNFKAAIDHVVFDGAKVLELGGGTGVLSCFAAARASKVWCVEFNPDLVAESRRFLALNPDGAKVEVVHSDAFEYLPPEPVDVVICEMIHVAMLREKQIEMIESFKQRYLHKFGGPLPVLMPEAVIMAVQPLQQDFNFHGFYAPIILFQRPNIIQSGSIEPSAPQVYSTLDLSQHNSLDIQWEGNVVITQDCTINALRFITKNILAVLQEQGSTIDWLIDYLVLPLAQSLAARSGDLLHISFNYRAGASIRSLERSIRVSLQTTASG